jgi:ornithine cyclodeaminase/alanine dehydrogenase-like protein (mu-crystallin family)
MRTFELDEIRTRTVFSEVIDAMRDAVVAQSSGDCDTPMPMHLAIAGEGAEVHIKSSYRRGGEFFAVKAAGSFPKKAARGEPTGSGSILLCSASTGDPVAFFDDRGWMTDVRTAAVAALAARALGRRDEVLGILGSGVQARHQARLHAEVLPLRRVLVWGRTADRIDALRRDLAGLLPGVEIVAARSVAEVAERARLIVTTTSAREPLLGAEGLGPGTHVSAVGSDSPGKQELDPEVLRRASLLLVDSIAQCARLGELQHAPSEAARAVELGSFCASPRRPPAGLTVCDFTGLGVEDLAIAEHVYRRAREAVGAGGRFATGAESF